MARRRKSETTKVPVKQQPNVSAVRKSSRQRAKKQLDEQKVNGDITSSIENTDDSKDPNDNSQDSNKKVNAVPKKSSRYKNVGDKEKAATDSGNSQGGESDSQEAVDTNLAATEKVDSVDERQITASDSALNEIIWPEEDVIEETIICEEMEVETEMTGNYSIAQDGSVVVEQVVLVDDPNFVGKDVVEYTVIQNEDGTESMMVAPDNLENVSSVDDSYKNSNSYQMIEQGLSILHMSEPEITEPMQESENILSSENIVSPENIASSENIVSSENVISENIVNSENEKSNDASLCNADSSDNNKPDVDLSKKECRSLRSVTKNNISTRTRKTVNVSDKSVKKESDKRKKRTESSTKRTSSVENKSQKSENKEKSTKTKKTNTTEENVHRNSVASTQNITVITQEDDNSSSMSDKIEHQAISNVPTNDSLKDKIVNNSVISEQKNALSPTCTKSDNINRLSTKTKNSILGSEEHSRDSEVDGKMDSEDAKVSSSSENSNDTLLSSNSCKFSEFNTDNKISANQLNESDKKPGFRSRSGSTDTTGSESGSNSSGVRRSNRIRTIGLMKQRSRGRGVVTKPSVDAAKIPANQDRDKLISSTSPIQEKDTQQLKNNLDNVPETQSDKENSSYKTTTSQDIVTPLISTSGITGYDSDSNKPVKVKSRWRRSSELEMSNSASWSTSRPTLGFPNSAVTSNLVGIVQNSFTDTINKLPPLPEGLPQDLNVTENLQDSITKVSSQNVLDMNISTDTIAVTDNSLITDATTVIPKTIGAKISLPMVPVIGDREMEERLSQFEHLRENLYLTERFTSKETKRMVCDCFLTDEEIVRGELGCGEDCLNRLLMIECGSRCVNGDRCTNKRFQNCEYANCEVFRTEKKGFGLRATSNLFPGDFIMEYVGEVVDPRDFRKRAKEYSKDKNRHYYFMALKSDQIIDATMKGNISRFINHSCDPNAETQKWTVNGELRIGFFNKKFVAAGEEITFDYHFQRYGKEAQKCFCEAINCRGWIGDNPEDGKERDYVADMESTDEETEDEEDDKEDKENKEEKPEKQIKIRRKRVEKKKDNEHMEDEDLEEQIDKLCANGLKNRSHTLTLSRLMVRSREIQHRSRLLKVIRHGAQPCRRLFLDYHGLRLMWSYMMDVAGSTTEEAQQFRLEILRTLNTLPIPNRTMLLDSKVLSVVEKWSKQLYMSPNADSPEDDQSKLKSNNEETEMEKNEKTLECSKDNKGEEGKDVQVEIKNEIKTEAFEHTLISELATNLLVDWANLKEVFRIPKKERIEQMKEHEREADRGYKEDAEKEAKESTSYERPRSDRYNRNDSEKRSDRRRGRDSPDFEHNRVKDKRTLEERNLVQVPRMSKFERRQLFAMKVAKEEEERQRRQQEESWQQHQSQCLALGMDPFTTAAFDPQTGYPLFFNPQLAQWQAYPPPPIQVSESGELSQQCTQVYVGGAIPPPVYPSLPGTYGTPVLGQIHNGTPSVYVDKVPLESPAIATSVPARIPAPIPAPNPSPVLAPPPALDLPPKWKWARDKRGRIYYYHIKERISQWLPPPPDHIAVQPDSSTTSESSDESSSSNDEDEEPDEQLDQQSIQAMEVDQETDLAMQLPTVSVPEVKKRRDGLVQERIISPRREEDRVDHKKYKEIKEKLRRQKERAKLKEHFEKMRKHRRSSKSKTHVKHSTSKLPITSDMSPTTERKIKDTFRINMANVMVHFLNPYRKADCKQGRITNTDDFKHLARKLTHFVLAKELKHCKSVDELECNDNVKHKAKDFVRKYMNKFGAVYQKGTDED